MILLFVFAVLNLIFPKPSLAVYEEYYYYKNCQRKEMLKLDKTISQRFVIDKDFGAVEVYFEREGVEGGDLEFVLKRGSGEVIYKNIYPLEKVINGYFFPFGFEKVKVDSPEEFVFSIKLLKNPSKAKIYVCKDNRGNLSFIVSGERSLVESLKFWLIYNIKKDLWFFVVYFGIVGLVGYRIIRSFCCRARIRT